MTYDLINIVTALHVAGFEAFDRGTYINTTCPSASFSCPGKFDEFDTGLVCTPAVGFPGWYILS